MLISVQALRAFAAWLVVFHHFMQVFFDFEADRLMGHLLSTRGQVGVDIFFVISGFVIYVSTAGKHIPSRKFLLNRIARVVPAYWLYTAITALIIYYAGDVMPVYGLSAKELVMSMLFLPSENPGGFGLYPILPVGWSLNFEMLFYVIFALSLLVAERYRLWVAAGLVVIMCPLLATQSFVSDFYTNPIIFEFLFGIVIGVIYKRGWIPAATWSPALIAAASFATPLSFNDQNDLRLLTWGVPSALLVASFISMEALFGGNRVFKAMGDWSYSVYLVHIIVLWVGDYVLRQRLGIPPYTTLALCLPVIVALSWLSFEIVEKQLSHSLKRILSSAPRLTEKHFRRSD
ncbi:acyltransferase family protein [Halomonas sp. WWR20]